MSRGVRVLAVHDGDRPIAFAQLEHDGDAAEISQVFVHPDYRGGGRGTAMTRAAIEAAGDVRDLWIVADDEDRPKELYARLGLPPGLDRDGGHAVAVSADPRRAALGPGLPHAAVRPPSITSPVPVMKAAASEAR